MKMAARKGRHDDHDDMERLEHLLDEQQLEEIYAWVDSIPLNRPKRDIKRDFSDGAMVLEIIKHHMRGFVGLTVPSANGFNQKVDNWRQINRKVFSKLNFELADDVIKDLVGCKPGCIEKVLMMLKSKIDRAMYAKERRDKPESEQHEGVSPGRKGANIKVGIDSTKGGKFVKTKQENEMKDLNVKSSSKLAPEEGKKIGATVRTQPSSMKTQQAHPQGGIPKKRVGNMAEADVVPRYVVEEKEQEVLSRDETIQILLAKIDRLEHLLKLKDLKIIELQKSLQNRTRAHLEQQNNSTYNNPNQKPRYYR